MKKNNFNTNNLKNLIKQKEALKKDFSLKFDESNHLCAIASIDFVFCLFILFGYHILNFFSTSIRLDKTLTIDAMNYNSYMYFFMIATMLLARTFISSSFKKYSYHLIPFISFFNSKNRNKMKSIYYHEIKNDLNTKINAINQEISQFKTNSVNFKNLDENEKKHYFEIQKEIINNKNNEKLNRIKNNIYN